VLLHGSEPPVEAVACDLETDPPGYLVFSVFFSDHLERGDDPIDEQMVICASCFIDEHPEVGRAFDLGKRGRGAWKYDPASDEWAATPTEWD
jgi:hypothetical protein